MKKMIFSRKKSTFFLGGWDGGRFGGKVGKLRGGGRVETPLHFLVDSFGGGTAKEAFSGCCTGGKKCVNLQVIVPGRFGNTQNDTREHIRT